MTILPNPLPFQELAARAEALVRRSRPGPEIRVLLQHYTDAPLDLARRTAERGGRALVLQPREFRLLAYFLMHAERVLTRTMLLEAVWDTRLTHKPTSLTCR